MFANSDTGPDLCPVGISGFRGDGIENEAQYRDAQQQPYSGGSHGTNNTPRKERRVDVPEEG